jgi:hypothetical protein
MPEDDMPASPRTDPPATSAAGTSEGRDPASKDRLGSQYTPVSTDKLDRASAATGPRVETTTLPRSRHIVMGAGQASAEERPSNGPQRQAPAGEEGSLDKRRAAQQLSQEQATFEQAKFQDKCIFVLRMIMGVLAIVAIPVMTCICYKIIFDPHQDVMVKRLAASALFVSIAGLVAYVWRVLLSPSSVPRLRPVTTASEASSATADQDPANPAVDSDAKRRRAR